MEKFYSFGFFVFTLLIVVLTISNSHAQVGVGTTNPQQDLHIAGSSSTIRIDGLNSSNNANNTGLRNQAVYVNGSGDMIIPNSPAGAEMPISNTNFINNASPVLLNTGNRGQGRDIQIYQSPSFTLSQRALVTIYYTASYEVLNYGGSGYETDGKPKIIQNYFYLGDGTSPDTSVSYGLTGSSYSNGEAGSNHYIATGFLFNTAADVLILDPGTYSIHVYGFVFSADGVSYRRSSDAFSANFGVWNDLLKVVVMY